MAILKTFLQTQQHFDGVLSIPNAYWRVDKIDATKNSVVVAVSINVKNDDSIVRVCGKQYEFTPSMTGGNFIEQAYKHLKTLPEFAGAIDC
jgi:hypothetical protein